MPIGIGNVRELSNLIERLAVLHPHAMVGVAELPARYRQNIPLPVTPVAIGRAHV